MEEKFNNRALKSGMTKHPALGNNGYKASCSNTR